MVSCYAMGDKSKRTNDLHKNEGLKHASKTGKSDSALKVLDDNSSILNPVLHVLCDTGNFTSGDYRPLCRAGPTGESKNVTVPFTLFLVPPFLLILWLHRSWPAESRRSQTILFLSRFRRPAAGGGAHEKSSRFSRGRKRAGSPAREEEADAPLRERESPLPNRCRNARTKFHPAEILPVSWDSGQFEIS